MPGEPGAKRRSWASGLTRPAFHATALWIRQESRVDSSLLPPASTTGTSHCSRRRTSGRNNKLGLQFRTEFFNTFNRVQFGFPGTAFNGTQRRVTVLGGHYPSQHTAVDSVCSEVHVLARERNEGGCLPPASTFGSTTYEVSFTSRRPAAALFLSLHARATLLIWPNFSQPSGHQLDSFFRIRARHHERISSDANSRDRPPGVRCLRSEDRVGNSLRASCGQAANRWARRTAGHPGLRRADQAA